MNKIDDSVDNPLVSIIVAVRNGVSSIRETLDSAFAQDYSPVEIIVIDGGSIDGTQSEIACFSGQITTYISEPDNGIADAWNKALGLCRGEYVAFLNCGDAWPSDFLTVHMRTLPTSANTIQYGMTFMTTGGLVCGRIDRSFDIGKIVDGFGFMHTSTLCARSLFDVIGKFDTRKRIAIDTDWMLRAIRGGACFNKVEIHNFMDADGVSSRKWLLAQKEYLASLADYGFIPSVSLKFQINKYLQSMYLALNLHKSIRKAKIQVELAALSLVNLYTRLMPPYSLRKTAWTLIGIRINRSAILHQGVRVTSRCKLAVDEGSVINRGTLLDNRGQITIGKHVSIAHECRVYTAGHDYQAPDFCIRVRSVRIKDYAVLFAGAVIMPGVTVGRGAIILPFSVVTRDVPDMAVAGGAPATIRGTRKENPRYKLDYRYWFAI